MIAISRAYLSRILHYYGSFLDQHFGQIWILFEYHGWLKQISHGAASSLWRPKTARHQQKDYCLRSLSQTEGMDLVLDGQDDSLTSQQDQV